jgi:hypothetical protein
MEKKESPAAAVEAFDGVAADLAGARLFDPSGMQRPFKDWVEVPVAAAADWPGLAEAALGFATAQ